VRWLIPSAFWACRRPRSPQLQPLLKLRTGKTFEFAQWLADQERILRFYVDRGFLTARVVPTRTMLDPAGRPGAGSRSSTASREDRRPRLSSPGLPRIRHSSSDFAWPGPPRHFDLFAAADMTRAARDELFDRGYVLPVVETTIAGTSPAPLIATVTIQAGPHPKTRAVTFDGMSVLSELELVAVAVTSGTAESAWRDPESLCIAIAAAYRSAGHRSARGDRRPCAHPGGLRRAAHLDRRGTCDPRGHGGRSRASRRSAWLTRARQRAWSKGRCSPRVMSGPRGSGSNGTCAISDSAMRPSPRASESRVETGGSTLP